MHRSAYCNCNLTLETCPWVSSDTADDFIAATIFKRDFFDLTFPQRDEDDYDHHCAALIFREILQQAGEGLWGECGIRWTLNAMIHRFADGPRAAARLVRLIKPSPPYEIGRLLKAYFHPATTWPALDVETFRGLYTPCLDGPISEHDELEMAAYVHAKIYHILGLEDENPFFPRFIIMRGLVDLAPNAGTGALAKGTGIVAECQSASSIEVEPRTPTLSRASSPVHEDRQPESIGSDGNGSPDGTPLVTPSLTPAPSPNRRSTRIRAKIVAPVTRMLKRASVSRAPSPERTERESWIDLLAF